MGPIDIVMVAYKRRDITKRVINRLKEVTTTPHRLILIVNDATEVVDELSAEVALQYDTDLLVALNKNIGLQAAKNIGLSLVRSKYYIDTDNDILVPDYEAECTDWLQKMVDLMDRHPEFAAISMRPQALIGVGPIFKDAPEVKENNLAGGSMRMMRTDVVRATDGWSREFENRQEEWRICGLLKQKGYKVGYARDLFCYHIFGDGRWGYEDGVEHYHRTDDCDWRDDKFDVDPKTLIPKIKANE